MCTYMYMYSSLHIIQRLSALVPSFEPHLPVWKHVGELAGAGLHIQIGLSA